MSATLAATHEAGVTNPTLVFVAIRFIAPMAAAWGWERSMALERRIRTGKTSGIRWALIPERIAIKLGLADPTDRTASEVGAQHRINQLALAARHARTARDTDGQKKYPKALKKLSKALDRAAELSGLGTDPARRQTPDEILLGRLSVLYNAESLLDVQPTAPWAAATAPAPTPNQHPRQGARRQSRPPRP